MKRFLSAVFIGTTAFLYAQSNDCSTATLISVTADCSSPTAGTTVGATQSISGCSGNADDDVWYQFVATSTSHQIVVSPSASMDPVVQLFSGPCSTLISLVCKDNGGSGTTETINYNGLTIGNTYRIRVYHYGAGAGTGTFNICITDPPVAPSNDVCGSATSLVVNSSCAYTDGTTDGASQSYAGCAGTADDDVWYSFVATNSLQHVVVHPVDNLDLVFQVYSGSCATLSSLICVDNSLTFQDESSDIVGLVPGQTYYIRVYDYYQGNTGDFQICVTGTASAAPTNDEPCSAIQLPEITSTCQFSQFTTVGSTASMGAPTPSTCAGGSGAAQGGFSASSHDVWFAITVPSTGKVDITSQPNGGGTITDGVMALYSGNCVSLTQIACSDDNDYPGSTNDLLPFISASGLTPGSTVYLRYWGYGTASGTFGICVSTTTNDNCANALYICDINGYSASTSASYTPDRPDNMRGNAEIAGTYVYDPGTNHGGIFGQGGPWGTGAPAYDVQINNNSWIKFTASATTATLNVGIYDCWVGNYPSGGIQMQIFEGTNCSNFIPVSNFEESSTGFIITANNLTVGNDYYLMVDGYAGDICNYTITAESGVQFPDISDVTPICEGNSVTLTAPAGATSYYWSHNGATSQSVNVTPATTQTYYCEVAGLCDYKQLLDVDVTVNPNPTVTITNGSSISICNGESVVLNVNGANTYLWNTSQTSASINVSPTITTNFSVVGTDLNGCTNSDAITVNVNNLPTLSASPTAVDASCGASDGALNGATGSGVPTISYSWSDGSTIVGTSQNLTNVPAGTYFLSITDGNGCVADYGPFNVSNPGAPPAPSIIVSDPTPCINTSTQLQASNSMGGVTFNWTGPNSYTATTANITLNNISLSDQGTYCVSSSFAGCTGPSVCETITVQLEPTISIDISGDDSTICMNSDFTLTANGGVNYNWTGPNSFSSTNSTVNFTNVDSSFDGFYFLTGEDSEGCQGVDSIPVSILTLPTLMISADQVSQSYCSGSLTTLTATGASMYFWTGPDGFMDDGTQVTITDLTSLNEGYYYVNGVDDNDCASNDSIYITVITNVPASSTPDTVICPGETLILNGSGGVSYSWTGPGGFMSDEQNPLVTINAGFDHSGLYVLTIVNEIGCAGYDSTFVEVNDNGDCLDIPTLITPDKDGYNETWEITGIDKYEEAEVEIYNRWGNLVYSSSPYNNDWDGVVNEGTTIDGKDGKVPVGTYFYIIRLNDGEKPPFKGYIEVQY